jgi:hypothetical protein
MTGVTSGTGTAYSYGASEFKGFSGVCVAYLYVKFLHDICKIQIYIKTKFIYVLQ